MHQGSRGLLQQPADLRLLLLCSLYLVVTLATRWLASPKPPTPQPGLQWLPLLGVDLLLVGLLQWQQAGSMNYTPLFGIPILMASVLGSLPLALGTTASATLVLLGTAVAVMSEAGRAGLANPGAHGFSEVLYALSSAANNNGSAFAGLSANTPFYNVLLAVAMWLGRFGVIVPVLAMAGSLASKKRATATDGTLPTHGPLFVALLAGVVLLVGLLNYVPALALGPVVEHLVLGSPH